MSEQNEQCQNTLMNVKIPYELYMKLQDRKNDFGVSIQFQVIKALEMFLSKNKD